MNAIYNVGVDSFEGLTLYIKEYAKTIISLLNFIADSPFLPTKRFKQLFKSNFTLREITKDRNMKL